MFDLAKGGYNNEIKLAAINRLTNEDYIYEIATGNLSDLVLPARRRLEAIGSKKYPRSLFYDYEDYDYNPNAAYDPTCPVCGEFIDAGDAICPSCGTPVVYY